jgi:hypothetical protein
MVRSSFYKQLDFLDNILAKAVLLNVPIYLPKAAYIILSCNFPIP